MNVLETDKWATPPDLVRAIAEYWGLRFVLDAAALEASKKCEAYISPAQDSLQTPWRPSCRAGDGAVWLNPPYSRKQIGPFMHKAVKEYKAGATVVTLTRFDPTAGWFQETVGKHAATVLMLPRRVKFVGATQGYNFPVCAALFSPYHRRDYPTYVLPHRRAFTWQQ